MLRAAWRAVMMQYICQSTEDSGQCGQKYIPLRSSELSRLCMLDLDRPELQSRQGRVCSN